MKKLFCIFIVLIIYSDEALGGVARCHIPQSCTTEWKPVCGKKGNDLATFPNVCKFEQSQCLEGWEYVRNGDCYANQKVPLEIISIEKEPLS